MQTLTRIDQPGRPEPSLDPETRAFYGRTLTQLQDARVPFLVGGAYAVERYTGIARHTKDLDVFVRERDYCRALAALEAAGCRGEVPFRHWLAQAYRGERFVDISFGSSNGVAPVDDDWFRHAVRDTVLGIPVWLVPAEEMIWQKALIMERERFDGADAPVCNGPVLSRTQYVVDIEEWGHQDARVEPRGTMTADEAALWTEAGLEAERPARQAS